MLLSLTLCLERWSGTPGPHGCRGGNTGSNPGLSGSRAKAPFSMRGCSPQRFPGQRLHLLINNARYNYLLEIIPVCPILSVPCWSELWDAPVSAEEQQSTVSVAPSRDFQWIASLRQNCPLMRGRWGWTPSAVSRALGPPPPVPVTLWKGSWSVITLSNIIFRGKEGGKGGRLSVAILCVCVYMYMY